MRVDACSPEATTVVAERADGGTAHRLFASGGEEATSLRAITREAGVNVAAIHYHFGGRDGLLREVLDRYVGPLNRRRLALLDEAERAHGSVVPVTLLLEAFLRPDLELLARLRADQLQVARFLGRAYTQPSAVLEGLVRRQFEPVAARLVPLLRRALPDLGEDEIHLRLDLIVAVVTGLFATAGPLGRPTVLGTDDVEWQLRLLVAFFAPALSAPRAPTGAPVLNRPGG
ncbi:helix-turn-helix transcriptional regulator [Actinomadura soli]|uniref:Helix-turn-helix transcriptional regulator n=1 Tax=Actinomadura soli TaxID=2508997 RepID=A0A5C4J1E1_9ACTN|nr:TetR/AcrR family transcriptional regulator [Actinomadura soli]TMQ90072.1 helix-turn-helix transcriptional regulator [Actinomadura soli]